MAQTSHDQNFKNLFLDFPKEALEWLMPDVLQQWGQVKAVDFVRQEPKKHRLKDAHLSLDMPILFTFARYQLLLWLVEFQEDKEKFSIYKLMHYTTDLMEAHPKATIIPTVLFTDRTRWRKDVLRQRESVFQERVFVHFEYVFVKLFDFHARDYYDLPNPVVKILLPKMQYKPEERWEVIRQAYIGLYQLVSALLFEKYTDFIDQYAEVYEDERQFIRQELETKKETVMILQHLRQEFRKELQQEVEEEVREKVKAEVKEEVKIEFEQGFLRKNIQMFSRLIAKKFHQSSDLIAEQLEGLWIDDFAELGEKLFEYETFNALGIWIQQRRESHLS